MEDPLLIQEAPQGVLRLTLNRPGKRNALTHDLLARLLAAVEQAAARPGMRLLILDASGPVFCAGMDLGEMQARAGDPNAESLWRHDAQVLHDLLVAVLEFPAPTLAVVQGPVLAGGVGLVAACDLVLAAEDVWFALPEPKRGITASLVTPLLAYRLGAGPAGYLLLAGRRLPATGAGRFGLCHELCPADELNSRAARLIESILEGGPAAQAATKQFLRECSSASLRDQLQQAVTRSAEARSTAEAREGLAAFLEKRIPNWSPIGLAPVDP